MRLFVVLHTAGALLIYVLSGEIAPGAPVLETFYYEIRKQYNPVFISYLFFQISSLLQDRSTTPFQFCSIFVSYGKNL